MKLRKIAEVVAEHKRNNPGVPLTMSDLYVQPRKEYSAVTISPNGFILAEETPQRSFRKAAIKRGTRAMLNDLSRELSHEVLPRLRDEGFLVEGVDACHESGVYLVKVSAPLPGGSRDFEVTV